MNDVAIFLFGFLSNVILKLLDPAFTFFPVFALVKITDKDNSMKRNVLLGIKHIVQDYTATCHVYLDREGFGLSLRFNDRSFVLSAVGGLVRSSKFSHQGITTIIVKVHTSNVSVVQGTGTGCLVVVTAAGSIEARRLRTSSTSTGESRALIWLVLALESLQEIGS